jgi:hypothetical protein
MIARMPIRILACGFGLAALTSVALLVETSSRAQPPGPDVPKGQPVRKGAEGAAPKPVPDTGNASERDEGSVRAREDVASLVAYLKAKKYQLREAEFRLKVTRAHLADLDRQHKRSAASTYVRMVGELSVVEAEADRETRAAEVKDMEMRLDRATRRVARIDRGDVPGSLGLDDSTSGERLSILEREADRLRYEMDRADKGLRMRFGVP